MLDQLSLDLWCQKNDITPDALKCIQRIRCSQPVRLAHGGKNSISVRYPSKKMGRIIQAESHKNELPRVLDYENDDDVLEYWDQPSSFNISFHLASGRKIGCTHTPDFFVIYSNGAGWEECKLESEIESLAEKHPDRFIRDTDGTWRCPPGEQYAAKMGLSYRVRTSSEINWVLIRNYNFLEDYIPEENAEIADSICSCSGAVVRRLVLGCPGISLKALIDEAALDNADDIYHMILNGDLYVDLERQPLGDPGCVNVYPDKIVANAMRLLETRQRVPAGEPLSISIDPGTSIIWDGRPYSVKNVGQDSIWLEDMDGKFDSIKIDAFEGLVKDGAVKLHNEVSERTGFAAFEIVRRASDRDLEVANQRLVAITPILEGAARPAKITRTQYRWIESYREAETMYGEGYVGLIPRHYEKGNKVQRLPESTLLAEKIIKEHFLIYKQRSQRSGWELYADRCKEDNLPVLSFESFCKIIRLHPEYEKKKARMGNRAAYPHKPFYWELEFTSPRHGERPFEIAHIDHTELDLEFVDSRTGKNLGRAWLTLLVDAYSRRILAYFLSYKSPSYRSVMMIMRECVRRHGRLPQIIVTDGGKEFHGKDMEMFCARYFITKKRRRPAKGRDGSVLERLFGTINKEVIYNLAGNTQITKHVRIMTKSVDPKRHAVWTLERFSFYFSIWAYEIYDNAEHIALGQSPRDAFAMGLKYGGKRLEKIIVYDETFILLTLPIVNSNGSKIHPQGIIANGINYWCDEFKFSSLMKKKIEVRYDPFDVGVVYAYVNGRWTQCRSEYYSIFRGKTLHEIMAISDEIVKNKDRLKKSSRLPTRYISDYLTKLEREEKVLLEERREAENRIVLPPLPGIAPLTSPEDTNELNFPALSVLTDTSENLCTMPEDFDDDEYDFGGTMQ